MAKAVDLVDTIYDLTATFPSDERFGLSSQLRRATVSIPSNIAEGCGRNNDGELIHFIGIARGSIAEVETQLVIALRRAYIGREQFGTTELLLEEFSKMAFKLQQSIKEKRK